MSSVGFFLKSVAFEGNIFSPIGKFYLTIYVYVLYVILDNNMIPYDFFRHPEC